MRDTPGFLHSWVMWLTILAIVAWPFAAAQGHVVSGRDPFLWPFDARSPWNTPMGREAVFSGPGDAGTLDLLAGGALIHAGRWGMAIFAAGPHDPLVTVRDEENARDFVVRVPDAAAPDPMADGHLFVVASDHLTVLEMYRARRLGPGRIVARRVFRIDLRGAGFFLRDGRFPGVRAMDASGMGGVLRAWEVRSGRIGHALTFLLPYGRLRHGPVWPSGREDFFGGGTYAGHVPIGALAAIPGGVRLDRMGLSAPGMALARALQDFGAYCDDSVGTDAMVLTAENAAESLPELAAMRRDWPVIRGAMRLVLDNAPEHPGGHGPRRAGWAPPF